MQFVKQKHQNVMTNEKTLPAYQLPSTIPTLLGVITRSIPCTPRCTGVWHWSRRVIQRSHSYHRQQHIRPILKIKTFYQGSESERIFSIFWFLVGENWYPLLQGVQGGLHCVTLGHVNFTTIWREASNLVYDVLVLHVAITESRFHLWI